MRVAITGFVAQSWREGTFLTWKPGGHEVMHLAVAWKDAINFRSDWSQKLLQIAGLSRSAPNSAGTHALDLSRLAVCFASSKGHPARFPVWSQTYRVTWPFPDAEAQQIARLTRAGGPVLCPVAACASGTHALALGMQLIETGRADVVLAGASEPPQPEIILAAYRNMHALSKTGIMRPFDTRRDGFVPASGGALFVLESEAHAQKRGAPIHGFLSGTSLKCDATHMTSMSSSGDSIARAIEDALQKAGNPQIDYINAHGTATQNDLIEARAIASVFGADVPVSSTKPLTGHLLGASGAVEAAICLLAMRDGFAPQTLNLETPEDNLRLDLVRGRGREMEIGATLSLNYGFGGHIGALILEKH